MTQADGLGLMTVWFLLSFTVLLGSVLWQLWQDLRTCSHGPDEEDQVEIPPECGRAATDDHTWFVCRRCGRRTVYTREQVRQVLDREDI